MEKGESWEWECCCTMAAALCHIDTKLRDVAHLIFGWSARDPKFGSINKRMIRK